MTSLLCNGLAFVAAVVSLAYAVAAIGHTYIAIPKYWVFSAWWLLVAAFAWIEARRS